MRYILLSLLFVWGCSSTKDKSSNVNVANDSFKKTKPLTNKDVKDFYQGNVESLNPALQDETLDRFTADELKALDTSSDPLMEISVRCSRKDFDEAFAVAARFYNQYQRVAAYWNQVANCHLNQGSFRKALLFYNKSLEVTPNYVPALNNIGVMYSRQGQEQKALVAFERANRESKFSKTPRYNLAKLYLAYGLAELALPIFESLLNKAPQDVDILNATGTCYFLLSDYNRAISTYQKIPQSEWSRAEVGLNIAFTYNKLGKRDNASKVFDMVKEPKNSNLKKYYAVIEKQLGAKE